MAQHDGNIANQLFPATRTDLNAALLALFSNSSGSSPPSTTYAFQWWIDTSGGSPLLKIRDAANTSWTTLADIGAATVFTGEPAGVVKMYAGPTPPAGWLVCDGNVVSRTTYSALFTAIGTYWGGGDGSTTFNLPDFRARVPLGLDLQGTGRLGAGRGAFGLNFQVGEGTHTLTGDEMPYHGHAVNDPGHGHSGATSTSGQHNHTVPNVVADRDTGGQIGGFGDFASGDTLIPESGSHSHDVSVYGNYTGISLDGNGGNQPHENVQPSLGIFFIIKT